jgi:hypothetical protein
LQDELKDQEMYRVNTVRFFWHSLGLGLMYLFCSLYLWAMISSFSFIHLLISLGYVLILCIFPDQWLQQLFVNKSSGMKGEVAVSPASSPYQPSPSKSLFWIRALLSFFLSLSLIYVSEGLPVWTEYAGYFLEYSPYWLMIWAMSFTFMHFFPTYWRKTSDLYKNTQIPFKRFKVYQRSQQQERLLSLLEQGDKWSRDLLGERERLRNERNEALFNGDLMRRKRVFETQLERLGYLYDLGMGGEESTLNASFRTARSQGKFSQKNTLQSE